MSRKQFTMTTEQRERILAASQPVPALMMGGTLPSSPQESANHAWQELASELGFVWEEQHAQDQRSDASDARKRIDAYIARRAQSTRHYDEIHWFTILGVPVEELRLSDIRSVLADADRDRQFVEAVREAARDEHTRNGGAPWLRVSPAFSDDIINAHQRIYGTPCAAKEKA